MLTPERNQALAGIKPRPNAVVFDLDGTLVDSLGDITASINELITANDLPPFSRDAIRKFIGDGVDALVERALVARGAIFDSGGLRNAVSLYETIYGARMTISTETYAGVVGVIAELKTRGVGIGVCTNKTEDKAVGIVEGLKLGQHVDVVVGARKGLPPKPSPAPLLDTLQRLGVAVADTIMVGDSIADVQCARAAGVAMIGVTFGYSHIPMCELGADVTIDSYAEFMGAYEALRARVP